MIGRTNVSGGGELHGASIGVTTSESTLYNKQCYLKLNNTVVQTKTLSSLGSCIFDGIQEIGTYTVEATDGVDTATDTIEITASDIINKTVSLIDIQFLAIVSWANGTDEQIVAMVEAADKGKIDLSDYWSVGDERQVNLSAIPSFAPYGSFNAETVVFVLMHSGLYDLVSPVESGRSKCSFIVGMKDCMNSNVRGMNATYTNVGSWKQSNAREWCNDYFYNALPSSIKSIFKKFKTLTAATYNGSTNEYTEDFFALAAEKEILGGSTRSNTTEANALTQFDYYITSANRVKNCERLASGNYAGRYWERSPYKSDSQCFCNMPTNFTSANTEYGMSPFGCI